MSDDTYWAEDRGYIRMPGLGHEEPNFGPENHPEANPGNPVNVGHHQENSRVGARREISRREEHRESSEHRRSRRTEYTDEASVSVEQPGGNRRTGGTELEVAMKTFLDAMTNVMAGRTNTSERVGTYTISDYLKLVTAMKNIGTTKFRGEPNPIEADEWLQMLEANFNATLCPNEYKKNIAVHYLEKEALAWWQSTERQFESEVSWDTFKAEFLRKYFPPEARDRLERRFLNLTQGGLTVRQYEAEFVKLRRYVFIGKDDESAMMRYFLNGLRPELSSRLSVVEYPNLNRMIERAANVEEKLTLMGKPDHRSGSYFPGQSSTSKPSFSRGKAASHFSAKGSSRPSRPFDRSNKPALSGPCYTCGQFGHISKFCPKKSTTMTTTMPKPDTRKRDRSIPDHISCFACGEKGHYASSCPNRAALSGPSVNRPRIEQPRIEPAPKKKAIENRVYALNVDEPGPSNPEKGPITGM